MIDEAFKLSTVPVLARLEQKVETIEAKWQGSIETLNARINGLDKLVDYSATEMHQSIAKEVIVFDGKILSLLNVLVEKIEGSVEVIKTRLDGNDTALVAALQAQKEAATKQTENFTAILDESKKGTTKQIDALNEKIDDLKEGMALAIGRGSGISNTVTIIISGLASVSAVVAAVVAFIHVG